MVRMIISFSGFQGKLYLGFHLNGELVMLSIRREMAQRTLSDLY